MLKGLPQALLMKRGILYHGDCRLVQDMPPRESHGKNTGMSRATPLAIIHGPAFSERITYIPPRSLFQVSVIGVWLAFKCLVNAYRLLPRKDN